MPTVAYVDFVMELSTARWLCPEESIDSDPAPGWTIILPCEGASETDPAPGWAFIHLGGILITCQLDNFLRNAYICMVERHPCTPEPPRRGPLCCRDPWP